MQALTNSDMASSPRLLAEEQEKIPSEIEDQNITEKDAAMSEAQRHPRSHDKTPEPSGVEQQAANSDTSSTPGVLAPFDWENFEIRYEQALEEADEQERQALEEANVLSKASIVCISFTIALLTGMKYFKVWASAASSHDDERAAKRLQTRQRFVVLAEEDMAKKQAHCEFWMRAKLLQLLIEMQMTKLFEPLRVLWLFSDLIKFTVNALPRV